MKFFIVLFISCLIFSCGNISTSEKDTNYSDVPEGAENDSNTDVEDDVPGDDVSGGSLSTFEKAQEEYVKHLCKMMFSCEEGEDLRSYFGSSEAECITTAMSDIDSNDECVNYSQSKANQCLSCTKALSCAQYFDEFEDDDEYNDPCPACEEVCDWE